MPIKSSKSNIHAADESNHGVIEALRAWPKPISVLVGLFVCAVVAVYFSAIVITLSSKGPKTMSMFKALGMNVGILMLVNLVAYRWRVFWIANGIYGVIAVGITLAQMVQMETPGRYPLWWKGYFFAITGPIINAYLFRRFRASVID